jgi:hypothetical protein
MEPTPWRLQGLLRSTRDCIRKAHATEDDDARGEAAPGFLSPR